MTSPTNISPEPPTEAHSPNVSERWAAEASFFDEMATKESIPMSSQVLDRYASPPLNTAYPLEYQYAVLGDVSGKRILEVGCGTGRSTTLLAMRGATVVGVDISPGSIAMASKRAQHHGVGDRVSFFCCPFEQLPNDMGPFDLIWIEAFLHHLPDQLPEVFQTLRRIAGPDCRVIFREPVLLSPFVRALRKLVPLKPNGTPDERPLTESDFTSFMQLVDGVEIRVFWFFARFERLFQGLNPQVQRGISSVLYQGDRLIPQAVMRRLGGIAVVQCRLK
jgi:SAM-dependent methyltransferase